MFGVRPIQEGCHSKPIFANTKMAKTQVNFTKLLFNFSTKLIPNLYSILNDFMFWVALGHFHQSWLLLVPFFCYRWVVTHHHPCFFCFLCMLCECVLNTTELIFSGAGNTFENLEPSNWAGNRFLIWAKGKEKLAWKRIRREAPFRKVQVGCFCMHWSNKLSWPTPNSYDKKKIKTCLVLSNSFRCIIQCCFFSTQMYKNKEKEVVKQKSYHTSVYRK